MRLLALFLALWAGFGPAQGAPTDHDGRWRVALACTANLSANAPPHAEEFDIVLQNGVGAANHSRPGREGDTITEEWAIRVTGATAIATDSLHTARGVFQLHLAGRTESPGRIVLSGNLAAPNGAAVRSCTATLTATQPAPASLAARAAAPPPRPATASQAAQAPAPAPAPAPLAAANPGQRRVALVIGNQAYRQVPALQNAGADARAMAQALKERGFTVIEGYDLDRSQMNRVFARFEAALSSGAVAVLYYAGHGVQVAGTNVLIPVDINPESERDLLDDGLPLPPLMERMAGVNGRRDGGLNLLIIDACRNNPFRATGRALGASRGLAAGGASGAMVLYAAASNQEALDRLSPTDRDPNGLFTRTLLKEMAIPGLAVRELVAKVRAEVAAAARSVGAEQTPAVYDEAEGDFVFTPGAQQAQTLAVPAAPLPAPLPAPAAGPDREGQFWDSIRASTNPADFQAYLQAWPNGAFAALARNRLAALRPAAASPAPQRAEQGRGIARAFTLRNESNAAIAKLYFGPTSRDGDSPDYAPLAPGATRQVQLPVGECSYELYVEWAPEARRGAVLTHGIDTCRETVVSIR